MFLFKNFYFIIYLKKIFLLKSSKSSKSSNFILKTNIIDYMYIFLFKRLILGAERVKKIL